jgi:hypothetical protein
MQIRRAFCLASGDNLKRIKAQKLGDANRDFLIEYPMAAAIATHGGTRNA